MVNRLREYRKKAKIPAKELQELLGLKTVSAYYKKEKGECPITTIEALALSDKLGAPVTDIFFSNELSQRDSA